ncbi:MAG: 1,6-anhydro-N-acetylmuramyl-L-alanine amidase AmpD, partial [Candidatus Competibacteraceae bacterium]|nr:1,6-anhydro-N-acetylmuramyl-L-alanine amidase AmpD [Candidatus Competibacteraceae bacterium]
IQGLRVSAHLLIRRDGTAVQYVSLLRRAWHAGVSEFQGRARCNDFAIGIELEGTDTLPYESHQYRTLARLVGVIQERWPAIDRTRIVGHCHIAPDRKTDPGPVFDWPRLWQLLDIAKPC